MPDSTPPGIEEAVAMLAQSLWWAEHDYGQAPGADWADVGGERRERCYDRARFALQEAEPLIRQSVKEELRLARAGKIVEDRAAIRQSVEAELGEEWVTCECCEKRLPSECAAIDAEGVYLCGACLSGLNAPLIKAAQARSSPPEREEADESLYRQ